MLACQIKDTSYCIMMLVRNQNKFYVFVDKKLESAVCRHNLYKYALRQRQRLQLWLIT